MIWYASRSAPLAPRARPVMLSKWLPDTSSAAAPPDVARDAGRGIAPGARGGGRAPAAPEGLVWDRRDLWALEDAVPRYALDDAKLVLWRRMALEVPELCGRSAAELRAAWLALQGDAPPAAASPPCLENWTLMPGGEVQGELHGLPGVRDGTVRATVVQRDDEFGADAAAAGDAWDSERTAQWLRGYVCSRDGDVFQLGLPHPDVADSDELEGVGADAAALVRPRTHAAEVVAAELKAAAAEAAAKKAAAAAAAAAPPALALLGGGVLAARVVHRVRHARAPRRRERLHRLSRSMSASERCALGMGARYL